MFKIFVFEQISCLHSLLLNCCHGYKIKNFLVLNALHAIFLTFIKLSESISYFQLKSTQTLLAPNSIKHEMLGTNGGKDSVCIRTFFAEQMTCVCTVEDVETTRTYKKIPQTTEIIQLYQQFVFKQNNWIIYHPQRMHNHVAFQRSEEH